MSNRETLLFSQSKEIVKMFKMHSQLSPELRRLLRRFFDQQYLQSTYFRELTPYEIVAILKVAPYEYSVDDSFVMALNDAFHNKSQTFEMSPGDFLKFAETLFSLNQQQLALLALRRMIANFPDKYEEVMVSIAELPAVVGRWQGEYLVRREPDALTYHSC